LQNAVTARKTPQQDHRMTSRVIRAKKTSPLFELARVLVRFNHIASVIVNANHGIM
jgi:hypothetical protein